MQEATKFPFGASAELYSSGGTRARSRPVSYRRFDSSAEAIRFAVEELPQIMHRGTVMEIGEDRYEFEDIRALYDSDAFPLARKSGDETEDLATSSE